MKRFSALFFVLFSLFLVPIVPAHSENLQIVMPRLIYIGDTIEIRSVFHSDALIFGGDFAEKPSATIPLRTDYEFFLAHEADFCVKAASLEKLNSEYTLNLTVIPWKTGFLQIPPFSLTSLVAFSQNEKIVGTSPSMTGNRSSTPFIVSRSPIEVKSGKRYTYSSLGKFMNRFNAQLDVPYILHTADYSEKDGIVFIPVYWTWLL